MPTPLPDVPTLRLIEDHADLLSALNARGARYLIVGGYAVGLYAEPRATKDLDIFILCSEQNSVAVFQALADFGAPLAGYSPADFNDGQSFFQLGRPPGQVDVLQVLSSVVFAEAWEHRMTARVNDTFEVPIISTEFLIQNKRAAGRPQDLADVYAIERKQKLLDRYFPQRATDPVEESS